MNRIVVFNSKTGFTEKYARWISEELNCEAVSIKKLKLKRLRGYDQVIYGGSIFAGTIKGLKKIKKLKLKNLVIFATGMTIFSDMLIEQLVNINDISKEGFFYYEGGFNPKKVGAFGRMIVNMIGNEIKKKDIKTEEDNYMLQTIEGTDRTNKENINDLLEYVRL